MNYLQKKKLAFMSIVNRVKGFIRTITGALPLTLEGCVDEESIIDYTIYGNSVQDGTPTPETPVEVESVGEYDETTGKYKIPVKVSGKNLFDINKFITLDGNSTYYEINENGELVQKASDYRGNTVLPTVAVLPTGTYIISGFGSWSTFRVVNKTTGEVIVDPKFTLTEPTEIAVKWWAKGGTVIGKPMLREGTTATDYEPYHEPVTTNIYLDEPLRKVGEYADYVDFENGKVVRNVKGVRLNKCTGTYTWIGKKGVTFNSTLDKNYDHRKGLCNRNSRWTANGGEPITMWLGVNSDVIYWVGILDYLGLTTVTEMNEWLTNNPTYVFYGTNLPTETPITLPTLPTFKGTSIISADTTIQPSSAEITYYSNVKE